MRMAHAADQWKMVLFDWESKCSCRRQRHQFETVCDELLIDLKVLNVASTLNKQKAASTHHAKNSINKLLNKLPLILLCTIRIEDSLLIAVSYHSKVATG
jgi:hypothetical protein